VVGCDPATVSWTVWVALWTTPVTAGTGADAAGALVAGAGELAVGAAVAPVLAVEAAVLFVVVWLAGAVWAAGGCAAATVPWTVWLAPWATPLTPEPDVGEAAAWVAAPAPDAVLAAGVLWGGVLVLAAEAPVSFAAACPAGGTAEEAEAAVEATDDTTSPAA
jgi:hypothetical protein